MEKDQTTCCGDGYMVCPCLPFLLYEDGVGTGAGAENCPDGLFATGKSD